MKSQYKTYYLNFFIDCHYSVSFKYYKPIEGLTYNEPKPPKIEDAGGEWLSVDHLGAQGWELIKVVPTSNYMVGIFKKVEYSEEIAKEVSYNFDHIQFNAFEIKDVYPPITPLKYKEVLIISEDMQPVKGKIKGTEEIIIEEVDRPNKDESTTLSLIEACRNAGFRIKDSDLDIVENEGVKPELKLNEQQPIPIPEPPPPPLPRIIHEGDCGPFCPECGGSLKKKFFIRTKHCIQKECKNYWEKNA